MIIDAIKAAQANSDKDTRIVREATKALPLSISKKDFCQAAASLGIHPSTAAIQFAKARKEMEASAQEATGSAELIEIGKDAWRLKGTQWIIEDLGGEFMASKINKGRAIHFAPSKALILAQLH